jgi:RimJ/RimL family protein N-acetyltransferase
VVFEHLGWSEVIPCIDSENTRSRELAIRLGAENQGPGRLLSPFEAASIDIWRQGRESWRRREREAM